MNSHFME